MGPLDRTKGDAGGYAIPCASWSSYVLFGAAGAALAAADHPLAAAVFLAAVALSEVLMLAWGQRGSA